MNIAIDVILAAIILACFITGWVKGFVGMIMKFLSFVLAGAGAYLLYGIPAGWLYDGVFLPKISSMIEGYITDAGAGMTLGEMFSSKPSFFVEILNKYSSVEKVEEFYNSGTQLSIADISEFMASPIARAISDMLSFLAVFLILLVIFNLLGLLINSLCKLPGLKSANTLLGIALGVLHGLLFAWILAAVLGGMLPYLSTAYPDVFDMTIMENSILFKLLYNFNPLTLINL